MPPSRASAPARRRRRPGAVLVAPVLAVVKLGVRTGEGLFAMADFTRRHRHHPILAVLAAVIGLAATSGADTVAIAAEAPEPDLRSAPGSRATVAELPGWDQRSLEELTVPTTTTVPVPRAESTTTTPERTVVHAAAAVAPTVAQPAGVRQPGSPLDLWPHPGPITGTYGEHRGGHRHSGIDIDGETGETVWTAGPGRVLATGYLAEYRGYGLVVLVDHGSVETLYTHLSAVYVEPGQTLTSGSPVGAMGTTGNTTGSHLHFEVRQGGAPVDPMPYLPPR